ncbi:MAG: tRNA (guanosine(37)-N1)-methyltransferase TrmD [Lachnospiraceae bacterium]|nr:tRNA (guanosine(37)-N1)-methyltransferase TrmD [Lachnospiraceae bacterium]
MNFHIMTLFPEMVDAALNTSIIGRAVQKGLIGIDTVNIRDYAFNKHNKVDDYTYGGGAGMLMQAEPVYQTYKAISEKIQAALDKGNCLNYNESNTLNGQEKDSLNRKKARCIYLTPQGRVFNEELARELSKEEELILLCGHYEGIDERVLEEIVTDNISIGDYVLTGGELPAMILVDAISRLVPGVLNNEDSCEYESFYDGLLEYPQYSRPEIWHEKEVPEVLLSGHHENVEKWRREQSVIRTRERRPDMWERYKNERF